MMADTTAIVMMLPTDCHLCVAGLGGRYCQVAIVTAVTDESSVPPCAKNLPTSEAWRAGFWVRVAFYIRAPQQLVLMPAAVWRPVGC